MYIEQLTNVLQVAAMMMLALAAVGLYYERIRQEKKARMQEAGQFIQRWNSPEFVRLSSFLFDPPALARLRSVARPYEELSKDEFNYLVVMLNFFEEMALSIEFELADERLLHKYFEQSSIEVFRSLEPIIHSLRDQRRNKAIFVSFERLIGRWSFISEA